jgi:hypothetical protein
MQSRGDDRAGRNRGDAKKARQQFGAVRQDQRHYVVARQPGSRHRARHRSDSMLKAGECEIFVPRLDQSDRVGSHGPKRPEIV